MAGGEPRLGTTATYMRHNDHGTTHLSTEIDRLHDRINNEYRVFSAGSVRKWSKFGLEEKERAYPVGANLWKSANSDWVPLYEGKMVQAFDHRASGITTVAKNLHRSGQGVDASNADHQHPSFVPEPRYFIKTEKSLST